MSDRDLLSSRPRKRRGWLFLAVVAALVGAGVTFLLVTIVEHKQEAKNPSSASSS